MRIVSRLFLIGLLVATFLYIFFHFSSLERLYSVILSARWPWLLLATVYLIAFAIAEGLLFSNVYTLFHRREPVAEQTRLYLGATFFSFIAPSGGTSSIAWYVNEMRKKGVEGGLGLLASIMFYFFGYIAIILISVIGYVNLFRNHQLLNYQIATVSVLLAIMLIIALFLIFALYRRRWLVSILTYLIKRVNKLITIFKGDAIITRNRIEQSVLDITNNLTRITVKKRRLLAPLYWALAAEVTQIFILLFAFVSVNYLPSISTLLAGYAVGRLFTVVSITPGGLGVVEVGMAATFSSLGVSFETATVAVFLYRAFSMWLIFGAGFVSLRLFAKRRVA